MTTLEREVMASSRRHPALAEFMRTTEDDFFRKALPFIDTAMTGAYGDGNYGWDLEDVRGAYFRVVDQFSNQRQRYIVPVRAPRIGKINPDALWPVATPLATELKSLGSGRVLAVVFYGKPSYTYRGIDPTIRGVNRLGDPRNNETRFFRRTHIFSLSPGTLWGRLVRGGPRLCWFGEADRARVLDDVGPLRRFLFGGVGGR